MSSTNNNQQISLAEAMVLTSNFQSDIPAGMPFSEAFALDGIQQLLAVPGCSGLRIYFGRKKDDSICMILVAMDANGNDILPAAEIVEAGSKESAENAIILEDGFRCPPACPGISLLNP
jgi:hypothetical protein